MQNVDVLGFGTATLDYVANVEAWPAEGVKAPVTGLSVHGGGLIGTALVAVSRLGGKASMVTKLGRSEVASAVVDGLEKEGVDTSMIIREDGAEPIVAFVFTTGGTGERTIFHSKDQIRFPELEELPDRDWPAKTGCLLIDHYAAEPSLDAARAARENGIPIVIDFEREYPGVSEGLALATHIILGEAFAGRCGPKRITHDGKLVIQVMGATARQELAFRKRDILAAVRKLPGCWVIKAVTLVTS